MIRTAIRKLFVTPRSPRKPANRLRPSMTALEGRRLLSIYLVNNTNDSGRYSLREAVQLAGASPNFDTIVFSNAFRSEHKTINITGGDLYFKTGGVRLVVPDVGVTLQGDGTSRIITVGRYARVEMANVTITGGKVDGDQGGGVWNSGVLTLTNSTVTNNSAVSLGTNSYGGGIYNDYGTLNLVNTTVSDNTAGYDDQRLPRDGFGGGIANYGGTLYLTNSTVHSNKAYGDFVGSNGGGLYNYGTAYITNSTFVANYADNGGGIQNNGDAEIVGSTISQNTAYYGGGLFLWKSLDMWNTIVSGNGAPNKGPDVDGDVHSGGYQNPRGGSNLIGITRDSSGWGTTDLKDVADGLIGLADNGGPTGTMALSPASPAVGKGVESAYAGTTRPLTTDQRGFPLDSPPDIGAYQVQKAPTTGVGASRPPTRAPFRGWMRSAPGPRR